MTHESQIVAQMDVRAALQRAIAELRAANVSAYTLAAELLLLHAVAKERAWLYSHPEEHLSADQQRNFLSLLARRAAGEPVQHLTGHQEFWGLQFEVNSDVLIPRPETEHVIEVTLDRLALREIRSGRTQITDGAGMVIADVGTGSGLHRHRAGKRTSAGEFLRQRYFASRAGRCAAQRHPAQGGRSNPFRKR